MVRENEMHDHVALLCKPGFDFIRPVNTPGAAPDGRRLEYTLARDLIITAFICSAGRRKYPSIPVIG
jgi:hypothetical protein